MSNRVLLAACGVLAAFLAALYLLFLRPAWDLTDETGSAQRAQPRPTRSILDERLARLAAETGWPELGRCSGYDGSRADRDESTKARPLRHEIRSISRKVETIRRLSFEERAKPKFLSKDEVTRRIVDPALGRLNQEYFELELRLLAALGVALPSFDLRAVLYRQQSESLLGYYVPATGELVVRKGTRKLTPVERIVLAHELEHAVSDQNLARPYAGLAGGHDALLASTAVVEGDATLTMHRYAAANEPIRASLALLQPDTRPHDPLAQRYDLPYYVEREGVFPYVRGWGFICWLHDRGGWNAVNRAYRRPPTTSAQILFPQRYLTREGAHAPQGPGALPRPWFSLGGRSFGAANVLWLFEAPGDDEQRALDRPLQRAAAWAGGEIHAWVNQEKTAVALLLVERGGGPSLCGSVRRWYRAAFAGAKPGRKRDDEALAAGKGATQSAVLTCPGNQVRLGIAPTFKVARALVS